MMAYEEAMGERAHCIFSVESRVVSLASVLTVVTRRHEPGTGAAQAGTRASISRTEGQVTARARTAVCAFFLQTPQLVCRHHPLVLGRRMEENKRKAMAKAAMKRQERLGEEQPSTLLASPSWMM